MNFRDDIETILIELNAGIVPTSIFVKNQDARKDPFSGMKKSEARTLQRKWRKLKKKYGVKKTSFSVAAWKIGHNLRKESNDTS